ncbi:S41 family peptidase [Janthinobacterium lividum]|uniref:S41 family peptidase n=1 Tax=Janthinobacterium lividum TaxID=29581 RepID=UPI0008745105|nr:S41 family peptidase [Janthinobacterium lividum]MCC7713409.1 S41 family peptidase [Janthinobacterium lividum]OEZ55099.1 carboxy-terminal protease [Janthinobacterium lividum]WQE26474.1 S41 family peptidase [Janthinobacterium lividum]STQ97363.1 carboxy-terminal protease [Janthinobacterium lividum]
MRYHSCLLQALSALSIVCASGAFAEVPGISRDEKGAIIASLDSTLNANYPFPDIARKITPVLQERLKKGDYDAATTKAAFASKLTDDLLKVSGDLHFFVGADAKWIAEFKAKANPALKAKIRKEELSTLEESNFGFDEVARLKGNIGYIRFSYFADPELAYDTAASAMRFVGNTDAVIIDLRYNNGGHLEMAQFLASYFFSSEKDQLLFDYYYNEDGKRIQRGQWVLPGLPGKRMVDKPVYILTGSTSFSSAEWFSYAMKKLGRATLIGERTAGGAHPVARKPLNDDFFLQVPIGQIQDPVDHGDFEGAGVQPDIPSPSIRALPLAHKLALENLAKTDDARRTELAWLLPSLTAAIERPHVDAGMLAKAAGKYEGRQIILDNGTLYYIWRDRFRVALEPIGPNLFAVEGVSDFRYRLDVSRGKVTALERVNMDGSIQRYKRLD